MVQLKDAGALPTMPENAELENLDSVFVGPSNISIFMRHPSNPTHSSCGGVDRKGVAGSRRRQTTVVDFIRTRTVELDLKRYGFHVAVFSSAILLTHTLADAVKAPLSGKSSICGELSRFSLAGRIPVTPLE